MLVGPISQIWGVRVGYPRNSSPPPGLDDIVTKFQLSGAPSAYWMIGKVAFKLQFPDVRTAATLGTANLSVMAFGNCVLIGDRDIASTMPLKVSALSCCVMVVTSGPSPLILIGQSTVGMNGSKGGRNDQNCKTR